MAGLDFPDDLEPATWGKKKPGLPEDSGLPDQLKALQKRHDAIDWKLFAAPWPEKIKTIAELKKAFSSRQRVWASKVPALEKAAAAVAADAKREGKKKGANKTTQDAADDIPAAVSRYGSAVDKLEEQFEQAFDKAMTLLEQQAAEEEVSDHLLMDPDELKEQLVRCKRNAERRVYFGYVSASDKHDAVFALSLKTKGSKMFAVLRKESGNSTGSFGRAWMQNKMLVLEQEKPLSGLPKKVKEAVKAAGFRVDKVILYDEKGKEFERDED